jgi:hypothetical protein
VALGLKFENLVAVYRALRAAQCLAVCAGVAYPRRYPLPYQVALQLGHGTDDCKYCRPERAAGIYVFLIADELDAQRPKFVERKIELVHIQPGRPMQNGRVESFHGRLREECLNGSWFGNLYEARGKIAAWRKDYNEERPHSSLGYRTPQEFARELSEKNGCGKDGGFAPLENASRFPLSHSHGGDGIATVVQVNGPDVVL